MKSDSLLAPLAEKPIAVIWTATFLSNIGTWMHDVSGINNGVGSNWSLILYKSSAVSSKVVLKI
ncbi:MAG: MFS transporter [Bdellovibrionales bacterium]|nr:MFS transporter [Bdellovibrionales bacterium]